MINDVTDLSGSWLGTYWQREKPTRFELTLVHGGNAISGSILDDSGLGEAIVGGEVVGRRISFTKKYLAGSRHTVRYTGVVSEDGDSMHGQWQINLFDSGDWEAHRQQDDLSLTFNRTRQLSLSK